MSVERKVIAALKWATIAKLFVQTVSWAGTLVVVRILAPEDYGLMAKVGVVCTIAGAIGELGLEAAIVRAIDMQRETLRRIYGTSLLIAAAITALLWAASPLIASLFHEPRIRWPIAVASLQILVGATALVANATWVRDLAFRRLATVEMTAGVTTIAMTVLLALAGAGVWALVLGALTSAVVRAAMLLILGTHVAPIFGSTRTIGEHLKFGGTVALSRVSYFALTQSDVAIGSGLLSTIEIGRYAMAMQLATLPMSKIMGTINQIALSAVARHQGDPLHRQAAVLKSIGVLALAALPCLWGISAVAPELVRTLFGSKWIQAVPALVILPLIVPVRMVFSILFTTSLALGNRRLELRNTIVNFIALPTGFYVGSHWGLAGLCASWLISVPIAYVFSVPGALRTSEIRAVELLRECAAPAIAATVMYGTVLALRPLLPAESPALALICLSLAGAIAYILTVAALSRRHLISAAQLMRSVGRSSEFDKAR